MPEGFHPKSNTLRLYTKRKERSQGLVSVKATIQDEIAVSGSRNPVRREELERSAERDKLHGMYNQRIEELDFSENIRVAREW